MSKNKKPYVANFFLLEHIASFYDLIPIIDLSLFITDHRFGFVWSDRIRSNDYSLCIIGYKLWIQYVRSEECSGL